MKELAAEGRLCGVINGSEASEWGKRAIEAIVDEYDVRLPT